MELPSTDGCIIKSNSGQEPGITPERGMGEGGFKIHYTLVHDCLSALELYTSFKKKKTDTHNKPQTPGVPSGEGFHKELTVLDIIR